MRTLEETTTNLDMSIIVFAAAILGAAVGMSVSAIVSAVLAGGCGSRGHSEFTTPATATTTMTTANTGPDNDACKRTNRDDVRSGDAISEKFRTGSGCVWRSGATRMKFWAGLVGGWSSSAIKIVGAWIGLDRFWTDSGDIKVLPWLIHWWRRGT